MEILALIAFWAGAVCFSLLFFNGIGLVIWAVVSLIINLFKTFR